LSWAAVLDWRGVATLADAVNVAARAPVLSMKLRREMGVWGIAVLSE
jgi:hypothetical protein